MKASCGKTNKGNVDCQSNNLQQIKKVPLDGNCMDLRQYDLCITVGSLAECINTQSDYFQN
jgi:hypothetical protein